jgi:hypothetical protein
MRKTKIVTIDAENRDKGKSFLLTEMGATQAEKWAARAFLALAKSGVDLPDGAAQQGLAGVAAAGLSALSGLDWALAEPLLDEMFRCIQIQPDPVKNPNFFRALGENDTEEVTTRIKLRKELLELHLGFSLAAKLSESMAQAAPLASPITSMSRPGSE